MMTQQLASSTPIEGLLDFGPKGTSEATVEGNPFSQLLAQFTDSAAAEGNTSIGGENGASPEVARIVSVATLPLGGAEGSEPAIDGRSAVEETSDANGDAATPEEPELPLLAALIAPMLPSQTGAAPAKLNVGPLQQPQVVAPATLTPMPVTTQMAQDPSRAGEDLSVALDALIPDVQKGKERVSAPRTAAATAQASEALLTSPDTADSAKSDSLLPAATGREAQAQVLLDGTQPAPAPLTPAADTAGSMSTDVAKLDTASPSQQLVERHLDLARDGQWLDRLARDIAHSVGSDGSLRFRLNPEHLGSLHVELTQGTAGASLRLTADTEAARAIIADAQPRLVAEARAQGVKIAETHVDLSGRDQSFQGQSFQGHTFAGDQHGARHSRGEEYLTTFQPEPSDGAVSRHHTARRASDRYA